MCSLEEDDEGVRGSLCDGKGMNGREGSDGREGRKEGKEGNIYLCLCYTVMERCSQSPRDYKDQSKSKSGGREIQTP